MKRGSSCVTWSTLPLDGYNRDKELHMNQRFLGVRTRRKRVPQYVLAGMSQEQKSAHEWVPCAQAGKWLRYERVTTNSITGVSSLVSFLCALQHPKVRFVLACNVTECAIRKSKVTFHHGIFFLQVDRTIPKDLGPLRDSFVPRLTTCCSAAPAEPTQHSHHCRQYTQTVAFAHG